MLGLSMGVDPTETQGGPEPTKPSVFEGDSQGSDHQRARVDPLARPLTSSKHLTALQTFWRTSIPNRHHPHYI